MFIWFYLTSHKLKQYLKKRNVKEDFTFKAKSELVSHFSPRESSPGIRVDSLNQGRIIEENDQCLL